MKKLITALFILFISINTGFSQTLISPHPNTDYSGPDSMKLTAMVTITNNGTQTLDVVCERFIVNAAPNHFAYFCWVVCYDTSVSYSPTPIQLAPGASTNNFEGWMGSGNTPGHDEVTYRFYDQNGNSDTLYLTFNYDFFSPTGVNDINPSKYSLNISGANPASNYTTLSYNFTGDKKGKILITNLLGSKIGEYQISGKSSSLTIPVNDFTSGIYICSLEIDGLVASSKKLIVTH